MVFASRITYYLRRIKNVAFFENGPQNAWLDPKKRQKTSKNSVFRGLEPLRGPEKQRFWPPRRGSSPVFGRFSSKNRAGTPPKTCFFVFFTFFEPFWVVFDPFFHVFWGFLSLFWAVPKGSKNRVFEPFWVVFGVFGFFRVFRLFFALFVFIIKLFFIS